MLKKILLLNAVASLLTISTSSVVLTNISDGRTKTFTKFSHPNFTENAYFSNEIQKALADYRGENEPLIDHTHEVFIANVEDGFLFPVGDEHVLKTQLRKKELVWENRANFSQVITISDQNLVNSNLQIVKKETNFANSNQINFFIHHENYQFELGEKNEIQKVEQTALSLTKLVPPQTRIKVQFTLNQKVQLQKYNYLLPIENDKWCKKNTGISGKVYQISPQELFNEIKDDPELLEYYFGLNEFYQYKNFIGKNDSPYLVWAATRFVGIKVEKTWNEVGISETFDF